MAILSRRRQPFDEALPDGRSVYDAVRRLSRGGSPIEETPRPLNPQPISPRPVAPPVQQEQNGIMMLPGRGYQVLSRDPNYPNEVPSQTNRRLEQNAIWNDPQGDSLQRAESIRDEFGDPVGSQFPVSAVTKTPLYASGYGAGYNKGPLDPGYEYKPETILSRAPTTTPDPNATTIAPRPLAAAPSFPATTDIAPEPLDRNVTPQTPSLRTIAPPPVMMLTRGGHAVDATGGANQMDANQTLLRTQQGEIPKRESKKMVFLRTLGGLALGGIPGAIQTAAGDLSDRRALDRGRINRNIADTQGDINRELLVRKSQDELLNNQTKRELEHAQAIKALSPTTYKPDVMPGRDGFLRSIDAATGIAKPVVDAQGNPIKGKVNSTHEWRNDAAGRAELWEMTPGEPDRKIEGATNSAKDLVQSPAGLVAPGTKLMADATAENRDYTRGYQRSKDEEELARKEAERGAEAQSLVEQSQSARAMGDTIDKQLRDPGGLYAQRAEIQSLLAREGPVKETEDKVTHSTRMSQLSALNSRIAQLEQGRNGHYSNADKLKGQATKFKSTRGSRGAAAAPASSGSFNLKGWIADHPNATRGEIDATRQKAKARQLKVIE